ncbi:MAG TPA: FAD-dependent oxidoreductase, partial [Nitrospiria bacterium]|nr:FAD-dependent oxidoreductase [Nitrospiria bacterium]
MRVTVIGAGVAGLACAVELAERGAQVEVLERAERL